MQEARKGTDTHLYRAIRLYGNKAFSWKIIGEFETPEEAKNFEREQIALLKSNQSEFGYNTTEGGEAPRHTEETKRKISQIQKDNPKPPEFYAHILALSQTPESRAKQAISLKQAWNDGKFEHLYGDNHWTRRLGVSEETKAKKSNSGKQAWAEGRHTGNKGKVTSEEVKEKIRHGVLNYWKTRRENAA